MRWKSIAPVVEEGFLQWTLCRICLIVYCLGSKTKKPAQLAIIANVAGFGVSLAPPNDAETANLRCPIRNGEVLLC
jgi:hypothetical protein